MNIRNLTSLRSATYDDAQGNQESFTIAKPGAGKSIAIYAVTSHGASELHVREAESAVSQTAAPVLILPPGGVLSFDAPIILTADKGVALTDYGCVLYQIVNNSVSSGSYA
jgi:hypothetical protein